MNNGSSQYSGSESIPPSAIAIEFKEDFQNIFPIVRTVSEVEPIPILDEPDANTTYIGYAALGTAQSEPKWKIIKITVSGTVTISEYADGNMQYDNVWNNRTSLSYTR